MTSAQFDFDRRTGYLRMDVRGHAGFDELGKDPVCAGASVLAQTAAQTVELMHREGKLQKAPHIVVRNGRVSVTVKPLARHFDEALHTLYVAEVGFALLAEAYPSSVRLKPFAIPSEDGTDIGLVHHTDRSGDRPPDGQEAIC